MQEDPWSAGRVGRGWVWVCVSVCVWAEKRGGRKKRRRGYAEIKNSIELCCLYFPPSLPRTSTDMQLRLSVSGRFPEHGTIGCSCWIPRTEYTKDKLRVRLWLLVEVKLEIAPKKQNEYGNILTLLS